MKNNKLQILITGVCGDSYGAQVAKSLSLLGDNYELIGADAAISMHSDQIKLTKLLHFPKANQPDYLDCLITNYKKHNIDYIIEGSEAEQRVLNVNRDALKDNKICWISNNKEVIDTCIDKDKLSAFLSSNNFISPESYSLANISKLNNISTYPVILKPRSSSSGSQNVHIAQNAEDVRAIVQLYKMNIENYCIQEYVGSPNDEYTVGILHSSEGKFLCSATLKRDLTKSLSVKFSIPNVTGRKDLGDSLVISSGISQGMMMSHPEIESYCREVAEKLGSTGPLNFQGRLYKGKFYIFEINPRFSGTSFMRALAGLNEADILIGSKGGTDHLNNDTNIKQSVLFRRILHEIAYS
jgi:carbamoyl-phosphate synthase large subunit